MAYYIDPFRSAEQMALNGQFQDAADCIREECDSLKYHVLNAPEVSWGAIKAAARRLERCERLIQDYESQIPGGDAAIQGYDLAAE